MNSQDPYIISAFKSLNHKLKKLGNEIIVLDFSHFSPCGIDNKFDIYFKFVASKETYKEIYHNYIKGAIEDNNSVWRKYQEGNKKLLYNFNNPISSDNPNNDGEFLDKSLPEKGNVAVRSDFDANKHLINGFADSTRLPGECFIIYAESHGDAQSIVYVLLKKKYESNPIENNFIDLNSELPDNLKDFDKELHALLVHEMVESLVEEKTFLYEQIKNVATRAAISQDQARAGSHNIGSHVLNRLISNLFNYRFNACYQSNYNKEDVNRLFNIQELLDKFSSYENTVSCNSAYNELVKSTNKSLNLELTELSGDCNFDKIIKRANIEHINNQHYQNLLKHQSKLNNYIKCRMDYLSDISFGIPAMQISKRFKTEVLTELDDVRLLLENISGLSDFKYSIKFKCDFDDDDDPAVAMPNDILGNQALFNLVENVLRNTAKHSDKSNIDDSIHEKAEDKVVKFTIKINIVEMDKTPNALKDEVELLYEVLIYDNIIVEGCEQKLTEEDKKDFKEKTRAKVPNKMSKIDYLVFKQNMRLNESILKKEDNTLRSTSLGLIEMEAAACYLRKMDVSNLENDEYQIEYDDRFYNQKNKINILKAVAIDSKYLGYRFFVLKPAEVLLIGDYSLSDNLKNNGFLCLTFDEFETQLRDGKVFNHQFLVYKEDRTLNLINETKKVYGINDTKIEVAMYRALLPKRIMKIESLEGFPSIAEEAMKLFWDKWANANNISEKKISGAVPEDNEIEKIHLLNHGLSTLDDTQKCWLKKWLNDDRNYNYIEALSSSGQQKLPSFSKHTSDQSNNNRITAYINKLKVKSNKTYLYPEVRYPIIESACSTIVIIDERVQYSAYNNRYEEYLFYKYYNHSNIKVPDMSIDLGANDLDVLKPKIEEFIQPFLSKKNYLVIHYSIIERFFNRAQNKETAVHKWLNHYSSLSNIIVTSGRGTLKNLPPNILFVNLSPLLASVIDYRSKYYLHQIIMSSRKPYKQ